MESTSEFQCFAALVPQEILCEYVVFWDILFTALVTSQEQEWQGQTPSKFRFNQLNVVYSQRQLRLRGQVGKRLLRQAFQLNVIAQLL